MDGGFGWVVACVWDVGPAGGGDGGRVWEDFDLGHDVLGGVDEGMEVELLRKVSVLR